MRPLLFAPALVLLASVPCAQEGKLEEVREAVEGEGVESGNEEEGEDDDDGWALWLSLQDDEGDDVLDWLLEKVLLLPFWCPRAALGDGDLAPVPFAAYPHAAGPGYWLVEPLAPVVPEEPMAYRGAKRWAARARVEQGSDFDDLERTGTALLLDHASRFGLDFTWNRWREDLGALGEDELELGDLVLVYRFANSARTAFRAGVGLNWLSDAGDEDYGLDFTYGAEWFPGRHLHVAAELDLGELGEADLFHARLAAGVLLGRFALSVAYDDYDVEGTDLTAASVGLEAWF